MILLDTHVVIWLFLAPQKLSIRAREAILEARVAGERIGFSPVSVFEIVNAARRQRLDLHSTAEEFIAAIEAEIEVIPLTSEIGIRAGQLPDPFHGDPIDRIIAATAIVEGCTLITHDDRIREANVCKVLW